MAGLFLGVMFWKRISTWMPKFDQAGDIAVNRGPNHCGTIWPVILFSLQAYSMNLKGQNPRYLFNSTEETIGSCRAAMCVSTHIHP